MHQGHDPQQVEEYAWRDIEAYLRIRDILQSGLPE